MNVAPKRLLDEMPNECRFVEVLTTEIGGEQIGYRYGGSFPGPNALIGGTSALIDALCHRLNDVPTLPWMWGKLYLVELDGVEVLDMRDAQSALAQVHFDDAILLPEARGFSNWQASVDAAYWTTMNFCRRLGMIEGRGVVRG